MKPAPLTDAQIDLILYDQPGKLTEAWFVHFARAIEAARDQQWQEMLAKQEPVAWMFTAPGITKVDVWKHGGNWKPLYTNPKPDHLPDAGKMIDDTALLRQALEALTCSGESDDPGHRCGHCDDYVDRNRVVRAALEQALGEQP